MLACAARLGAQQFFPPEGDTSAIDWYTRHLVALKEPSLWELSKKDPNAEVYRFLYLRSFDSPISIRFVITGDGGRLISKKTGGKGGFETGSLILSRESRLSKEATEWFLANLKEVSFWDIPAHGRASGLDGAEWIVEGVRQGRYHIVDRWSPDPKDPAHMLGIAMLINLARFRLLYQEVY